MDALADRLPAGTVVDGELVVMSEHRLDLVALQRWGSDQVFDLAVLWSRLGESNPGPTHCERGALTLYTTEQH